MTLNTSVIKSFLMSCEAGAEDIPLAPDFRVQIVPTIEALERARKYQFAAFVASEKILVVWDDEENNLVKRAKYIEERLMKFVWQVGEDLDVDEKKNGVTESVWEIDEETGQPKAENRPTLLLNTFHVSAMLLLSVLAVGVSWRAIVMEIAVDFKYTRLLFILMSPVQIFLSLFFFQSVTGSALQIFGPVRHFSSNSKFFSAVPSPRLQGPDLPHVTIQCPVYKEGLQSVIAPTVRSIEEAINTYELQGGTANIFINDDGLQLVDESERLARIEFYTNHNIGWVARPKHGENGFLRRGKFKKASNMNFAMMISCKLEEKLAQYDQDPQIDDSHDLTEMALNEVIKDDGRAWAAGNIRMGDYILIIDSDTRVPVDCLLDAVSEMELSPEVGILQCTSGVMQVVHTFFENAITFFTNLIYTFIRISISAGDVAPFVGHNAFLRWTAIQHVGYTDEDGYEKFWSESHVSEDFDMSLRLQIKGYTIRLAAWAGDGFKEGVSLTVHDELARWEKYAYGCNELLFNPVRTWLWKGPITKLFRTFLFSNIRFTSKVSVLSYIGTYYAIGAAWIGTTVNYFVVGWFSGYLDSFYVDSWRVWLSICVVFTVLGNLAMSVVRHRASEKSLLAGILEAMKWVPLFVIFFGGLSLHVSQALLSHFFEIDMTWGATAKVC
jgi:hypothetical protein